jgi:hypothetical protein
VIAEAAAPRRRAGAILLLALALAAIPFALLVSRFSFVCDDAYIAFRYSRHLAQGQGLVFNLGESPPVEGYSNLLWVLWLAPFERMGLDLGVVARATSIACGVGLIACVTRFAQRTFALEAVPTILTALFVAVLPPITMWSTGGLESMAFALCTFAVFERLCGDLSRPHGVQAGVLAGVAALLRADGALWIGLVLSSVGLAVLLRRDRRLLRAGMIVLAFLVVVSALHVAWRETYYGELLPNTARIKAGMSGMRLERGLDYLVSFFLAVPAAALVPLVALVGLRIRDDPISAGAFVISIGAASYAVYIGGDFMPMGRFLLPAIPFVAVLFAGAWKRLAHPADQVARSARARGSLPACAFASISLALALLSNFEWGFPPESWREHFHFRWNEEHARSEIEMWRGMCDRAEQWSLLGRALAVYALPSQSIILGAVGAVGYFCDLRIEDQFGLTDREVASRDARLVRASPGHDKVVGPEFFYSRRPTYRFAYVALAGSRIEDDLGPDWNAAGRGPPIELVRHPLRVEDGFPAGRELRLLKYRWNE